MCSPLLQAAAALSPRTLLPQATTALCCIAGAIARTPPSTSAHLASPRCPAGRHLAVAGPPLPYAVEAPSATSSSRPAVVDARPAPAATDPPRHQRGNRT
ncbi:hypothetical protein BS78_02G233400 [Paspalum vaginatum]|nr:hypothetical protein BS78_02G233400 [Paspalum vaginatum]